MLKKLLKNVSIQTLSVFLMSLLQLLAIIVLARLLTPVVFGQMAAASVLIALATNFSEIGIGSAIVQRKEITPKFISVAFMLASGLFLLLAVVIYVAAPYIAAYNKDESLVTVIRFLCIPFVFSGLSSIPRGFLLRELKYAKLLYSSVIPLFLSVNIISVALAFYGLGIWSLVIGQTLNSVLLFMSSMYFAEIKLKFKVDYGYIKDLFYFGGGITLSRVFNYLAVAGDRIILGNTVNLEFLGIFERLYKIATLISSQVGSVFDSILFPLFSQEQDNSSKTKNMYYKSVETASVLGLLISIVAPLFSYELTLVILGNQYLDYHYMLQILLFLPFTRLLTRIGDAILRAHAMIYQSATVKFFAAIITLSGLYIASSYEFYWIPFAYFLSSLFTAIALHTLVGKRFNTSFTKVFIIIIRTIFVTGLIISPIWFFVIAFKGQLDVGVLFAVKVIFLIIIGGILFSRPKILGPSFDEILVPLKNKIIKQR